jgi:endo-1,4-beta-D-glucanase Y
MYKKISKQHFNVWVINLFLLLHFTGSDNAFAQNKPFPSTQNFSHCTKPSISQTQLNQDVSNFYKIWKGKYLEASNGTTPGGGYFIRMDGNDEDLKTCSEAHGYGMIIFALMAGNGSLADAQAKTWFDGMFNMYHWHRSTEDRDLMSWSISEDEQTAKDSTAATDGDMDIAYALLLAHDQWGSNGNINYLAHAMRIIKKGFKQAEMSPTSKLVNLGDWGTWHDPVEQYWTRSSDWMTAHLHTFANVTGDKFFNDSAQVIYTVINQIIAAYSPNTGLMPDFAVNHPPQPAAANFLEGLHDGHYSWNACRYPWRIAMDYAHFSTAEAKTAMNKLVNWIRSKHAHPADIMAGYYLNGNVLSDVNYTAMAFTAPFMAACVVDPAHQTYLSWGWNEMKSSSEGYYEDTINLLCMLFISQNWWKPAAALQPAKDDLVGSWPGIGVWTSNSDTAQWTRLSTKEAVQLACGDMNGDQKQDVVGWWTDPDGVWICYSGTGIWEKIIKSQDLIAISTGDINEDGLADLVGSWTFGVFWRDSASGAWTRIHKDGANQVATGNIDGYRGDDIMCRYGNTVWIWINEGYGNFKWQKIIDRPGLMDVTLGDIDGNGRAEVTGSWDIGVWCYKPLSASWERLHKDPAVKICLGDMDKDGQEDLIGRWNSPAGVWVRYSATGIWKRIIATIPTVFASGNLRCMQ